MDPITVVGILAAVVQLTDVTSKVVNYLNNVKDARKDRAKLAREAPYLFPLFTELRDISWKKDLGWKRPLRRIHGSLVYGHLEGKEGLDGV